MHTNIKKKVLKKEYEITFSAGDFQDGGDAIKLVGSFNNWDTSGNDEQYLMQKGRNKKYKNIKLTLPAGEYQYKYFDPAANAYIDHENAPSLYGNEWIPNEYGTWNSLLSLPAVEK